MVHPTCGIFDDILPIRHRGYHAFGIKTLCHALVRRNADAPEIGFGKDEFHLGHCHQDFGDGLLFPDQVVVKRRIDAGRAFDVVTVVAMEVVWHTAFGRGFGRQCLREGLPFVGIIGFEKYVCPWIEDTATISCIIVAEPLPDGLAHAELTVLAKRPVDGVVFPALRQRRHHHIVTRSGKDGLVAIDNFGDDLAGLFGQTVRHTQGIAQPERVGKAPPFHHVAIK
ncbi:MAG: hypothetical protein BWY72_02450 [Bacteroidetes bacterium ADurb.Bin416]|nr:MAG: hypothetical protein BWY72_02450 [Bacteroidetes bacterium ADurb.Bin416]